MSNIILITVDALRADHLGQYGYARDTMPVLDRLLNEGTIFLNTYSNAPYTRVSVPSFHTSDHIGYHDIGERPTIASILSQNGMTTKALGAHAGGKNLKHGLGFDDYQDFAEDYYLPSHTYPIEKIKEKLKPYPILSQLAKQAYDIFMKPVQSIYSIKDEMEGYNPSIYTSASDLTDTAIDWLHDNQNGDFFLWLHYNEGHRPYGMHDPEPKYAPKISKKRILDIWKTADATPDDLSVSNYKLLIDQYDSNLRYCSRHLNRLFNELHNINIWDETYVVFSSDHGEEFYEHGMFTHRNLPYDELCHVPLIITGPNVENKTIKKDRELLDLGPTILDFCDIEQPNSFIGQNLYNDEKRKIILLGSAEYGGRVAAGRWDGWKYIWTDDREYLFNLKKDPLEQENVADEETDICEMFRDSIPSRVFKTPPEEFGEPKDMQERKRLEALGYLQ